MPLFGSKKKAEKKESAPTVKQQPTGPAPLATDHDLTAVIVGPRITEKAVGMSERNVFTFVVKPSATKYQVAAAIKALYNVTPVKVNIVNKKPAKRTKGFSGKEVHHKGMKKAYVYLKKGDTINLV